MNSTVIVDIPLVHNANIDINGGVLASMNPANDLTVNDANITIVGFSSQVNFASSGDGVPVTINNGHLVNGGVFMAGDTYISFLSTGTISSNDGDFFVSGDLTIDDSEIFENNLGMGVSGTITITVDAEFYNNMSASSAIVSNDGIFKNYDSFSANDVVFNNAGVQNQGEIYVLDSLQIGTNLDNLLGGSIYCDSGAVNIGADFYNEGSVSGDGGYYYIAGDSENALGGVIDGNIDVCDATLLPNTHLDTDDGWQTVDFNTVTFCSSSLASIDDDDMIEPQFELYPNPAKDYFLINGLDNGIVSVLASDGRVMAVSTISKLNNKIDIKGFPSGVYFIIVDTNQKTFTEKLKL
ncbi:MAG: T9SS type A sorting domain-containing protein [Crocinitomicaceae bacterium]|nr:T9SS type A sorting domain-containing protein [Crocinitomicaceae bacterium]